MGHQQHNIIWFSHCASIKALLCCAHVAGVMAGSKHVAGVKARSECEHGRCNGQ